MLTFDSDGRLVSIDTDVRQMDSLEGIEFYSGIFIPDGPRDGTVAFEVGTTPGVVWIEGVDWQTLSPTAESVFRKIL